MPRGLTCPGLPYCLDSNTRQAAVQKISWKIWLAVGVVLLHVVAVCIIVIVVVLTLPTNEPENTCEQAGSASMPKTTTQAPGE